MSLLVLGLSVAACSHDKADSDESAAEPSAENATGADDDSDGNAKTDPGSATGDDDTEPESATGDDESEPGRTEVNDDDRGTGGTTGSGVSEGTTQGTGGATSSDLFDPPPSATTASGGAASMGSVPAVGMDGDDYAANDSATGSSSSAEQESTPQAWQQATDSVEFASVDVGDGETLTLVEERVTAKVEGLRARTIVDHIYYNPHDSTLEGTFRYPLPSEASISYYAMFVGTDAEAPQFFGPEDALAELSKEELAKLTAESVVRSADPDVWGSLRVGQVVRADRALQVFEDITRVQVDPALVEEVALNSFEARVFPIQAHGYNRVIIAYEQTLPRLGEALAYTFPVPSGTIDKFEFTLTAPAETIDAVESTSEVSNLTESSSESDIAYRLAVSGELAGSPLSFAVTPKRVAPEVDSVAGTIPDSDENYFVARIEPDSSRFTSAGSARADAVFVLDTSLSEEPDRFALSVALLGAILENNADILRFQVLTFDTGARWLTGGWVDNTSAERSAIREQLGEVLLEGATDFGTALGTLNGLEGTQAADVFVLTDGVVTWGSQDLTRLVAQYESSRSFDARFFAYRTGLGAENLDLFAALTRNGATFNCMSTDSIPGCSTAHTAGGIIVDGVEVVDAEGTTSAASELVVAGRQATLAPGTSLTVAGRIALPGDGTIRVMGHDDDAPVTLEFPVSLTPNGELAPRAWGEILTSQLLQVGDVELDDVAMALSQRFRLVNRVASMLVLETDEEYEEYDLATEAQDLGDGSLVDIVDAAFEDLGAMQSPWQGMLEVFANWDDVVRLSGVEEGTLAAQIEGLTSDEDRSLPEVTLAIPMCFVDEAPEDYLTTRSHDPSSVAPFETEAERRYADGEEGAAVRALSSIAENSPSSAEALRLIGYRLRSWGETAVAARLFYDVLLARPYEPQSYRDLALLLQEERPAIAALLYEAILSGNWSDRFFNLQTLAAEEYALMIAALEQNDPDSELTRYLIARREALGLLTPTDDIRVTISWNTDNTDIDLWVIDPSGEKCYYANRNNANGGELLDDITRGFGPERFRDIEAEPGTYLVQAHYYGNNGNLFSATTHVHATVTKHAGTTEQTIEQLDLILNDVDEVATIAEVKF